MKKKRSPLVMEYKAFTLRFLEEAGFCSATDPEQAVRERFHKQWTPEDRAVNKAGTQKWRNDVHWARARLMMERQLLSRADVNGVDWLTLNPTRDRNTLNGVVMVEARVVSRQIDRLLWAAALPHQREIVADKRS